MNPVDPRFIVGVMRKVIKRVGNVLQSIRIIVFMANDGDHTVIHIGLVGLRTVEVVAVVYGHEIRSAALFFLPGRSKQGELINIFQRGRTRDFGDASANIII
ncbi:hypothetical protein D3C81_963390 [compost metagenome]